MILPSTPCSEGMSSPEGMSSVSVAVLKCEPVSGLELVGKDLSFTNGAFNRIPSRFNDTS